MCAIFGIVGPYDEKAALKAFATLDHRGPDGSGTLAEPGLFLGHHRLAVIDPHPEAAQPMAVGDAVVLLNGEIYNYRELRDELGGDFATASDTEVLGRAFLRWGPKMTEKLRGMYTAAIWHDGALHLFRDPFGKKPLYYAHIGQSFIFASEIEAMKALSPHLRHARDRIPSYLSFQSFVSPQTFFPDIRQLEAGGYLRLENDEIEISVSDPFLPPHDRPLPTAEEVETVLEESVAYRLVSDVPLGALLSGGIDSSLVAALAQRRLERPLPTFTVGYEGFDKYDERPYAALVARHIGSDHHDWVMGRDDFLQAAEALLKHLDEPLADPAAVPLWFLSRKIAQTGIKVLLTGDGADELFFGYRPYYEIRDVERAADLKYRNWLRNYFRAHYSPNKEWEWYKRAFEGTPVFRGSCELFTDLQQNMTLRQNVKDDTSLGFIGHYARRYGDPHGPGWYSYIDIRVQLGELFLKKLDRVTMAHGLEARSPFLDKELAALWLAADAEARMGEAPKWLLKHIAASYLPEAILSRKKKGFSYPYIEWLFEAGEIARLKELNDRFGLLKEEALDFYTQRAKKGRFKHHLYALWFLLRWLARHG